MTDQAVKQVSENKTAEVAPYLSNNKNDNNDTSGKTSTVVPFIIVLVVAVVIIASFFEDEYKSLIAGLNPEADTGEAITTTEVQHSTENVAVISVANKTVVETNKPVEAVTSSPATMIKTQAAITMATTPSTDQPGLITVYNPYLRPYPQVYAPIPPQVPYGMPQRQAKAYIDMMQKRQKAVAEMIELRNTAMQRRQKYRMEMVQQMEQQHAQAQKAHAEMLKRRQEANRI